MKTYKVSLPIIIVVAIFAMGGCDEIVHEPTHFTEKRVQIMQDDVFEDVAVESVNDAYIDALARHYARYGDGAVDVSVTYDPHAKSATAMQAQREASRITAMLRESGVPGATVHTLPVNGQGEHMRMLVSYQTYEAMAPEDCDVMPGIAGRNIEPEKGYALGCSLESQYAKQIARPKDLAGGEVVKSSPDGRRASNIVEGYRTGVPNESLEGETATE